SRGVVLLAFARHNGATCPSSLPVARVAMLHPRRAPVRPRVRSTSGGEALLLEDEIQRLLEEGKFGKVQLIGPAGSGKTTALMHLAAVLPSAAPIVLEDDLGPARVDAPTDRLLIYTPLKPHVDPAGDRHLATYCLMPWGRDDLIEYLLGT